MRDDLTRGLIGFIAAMAFATIAIGAVTLETVIEIYNKLSAIEQRLK